MPPGPSDDDPEAALSRAATSEQSLEELNWLKEPDDREVVFMDDDDFLRPSSSSAAAPAAAAAAAAEQESAVASSQVTGAVLGKAAEDTDVELQPLAGEGQARQLAAQRPRKPLWRAWPSRNKFFCRGMLMTGGETEMGITPNCSVPNLCVWTCILAPCSLYFLWVFPHLLRQGSYLMPLATLAVFLMATGFLLATCCSDPGIIPRREVINATDTAASLEAALGFDTLARSTIPLDGRNGGTKVPVDLTSRGYRWCRTCRIVRPPRASHCPDCDNCVLRYDHHCPFVNNCVGQRNYHFFFGFVTSVLCLAVLVLPVLFWFLNSDDFELAVDGINSLTSGTLQPIFYALIACGALIGFATLLSFVLWIYHVFLIATKQTTKEFRKSIPNVNEEPTICASRGPRLFNPWALVDPRDLMRPDEAPPPRPPAFCGFCWGDD